MTAPSAGPVPGATVHLLGNLMTFRATSANTAGNFSLMEVVTAPGAGAPLHLQRSDTEAFYVLEGRYAFTLGDQVLQHGPGGFVFVPKDVPHRFENPGAEPARMLVINVPGGLHENFFAEAGDAMAAGAGFPPPAAPDVPRLMAAAARYGIEILGGPPPA